MTKKHAVAARRNQSWREKDPPTFDIVVEIIQRDKVSIHPNVGEAIDTLLRQQPASIEIRWLDGNGEVRIEKETPRAEEELPQQQRKTSLRDNANRIFLFGVNKNRLEETADEMGIKLSIVDNINDANLFITSKQYYRRKPQRVRDAEAANIPIYVLKTNTPGQVRQLIRSIYPGAREEYEHAEPLNSYGSAIHEAEDAVQFWRDRPRRQGRLRRRLHERGRRRAAALRRRRHEPRHLHHADGQLARPSPLRSPHD